MLAMESVQTHRPFVRGAIAGRTLPVAEPDDLASLGHAKSYPAGATIYFEDDSPDHLFEVIDGVLKLYKLTPDGRRQVTGFVYPGQFLGLATLDGYVHTAEAVTAVTLRRYGRSQLARLADENPGVARRLLTLTLSDLVAAQDQMLLLGRKSAVEKLASFLLHLADQSETRGDGPDVIYLPMARTDIADFLGLTTETVSRILGRLKAAGVIRLLRTNQIKLVDFGRLIELAEADEQGSLCGSGSCV
ncbi:MAG: Crp/Fnr family transcriptional regulator [Alphaproteobacteria bacterium]